MKDKEYPHIPKQNHPTPTPASSDLPHSAFLYLEGLQILKRQNEVFFAYKYKIKSLQIKILDFVTTNNQQILN